MEGSLRHRTNHHNDQKTGEILWGPSQRSQQPQKGLTQKGRKNERIARHHQAEDKPKVLLRYQKKRENVNESLQKKNIDVGVGESLKSPNPAP